MAVSCEWSRLAAAQEGRVPILRCPVGHYCPPQPDKSSLPCPIPAQHHQASLRGGKKLARGIWLVFWGLFFLRLTRDTRPSPPLWNCLTWKDKGEQAKSTDLEGGCFGGNFGKTAGEVVLSGGRNAEERLRVRVGRRGRAELGGAEEPPWLLRVAELVSGPWAGSAAPSSHELPLLLLLALLIPSTSHRRPMCSLFPPSCPYPTYPLHSLETARRWGSKKFKKI